MWVAVANGSTPSTILCDKSHTGFQGSDGWHVHRCLTWLGFPENKWTEKPLWCHSSTNLFAENSALSLVNKRFWHLYLLYLVTSGNSYGKFLWSSRISRHLPGLKSSSNLLRYPTCGNSGMAQMPKAQRHGTRLSYWGPVQLGSWGHPPRLGSSAEVDAPKGEWGPEPRFQRDAARVFCQDTGDSNWNDLDWRWFVGWFHNWTCPSLLHVKGLMIQAVVLKQVESDTADFHLLRPSPEMDGGLSERLQQGWAHGQRMCALTLDWTIFFQWPIHPNTLHKIWEGFLQERRNQLRALPICGDVQELKV